jgi:hypothetical protein
MYFYVIKNKLGEFKVERSKYGTLEWEGVEILARCDSEEEAKARKTQFESSSADELERERLILADKSEAARIGMD